MSDIPLQKKRNNKLDMLRGHYLVAILVDHISYYGGISLFTLYNGNGRLWTSAAEGFIFLSGFFVSYVYYPKVLNGSFNRVLKSLWRRAFILYLWSAALTLIYVSITLYLARLPGPTGYIRYNNFSEMLIDTLLLRFSYGWADLLPLYVLLLLSAPVILYLFQKNLSLFVVVISFLIWLINLQEIECARFCISFFDLSSWQFLFVLGMYVAAHKETFKGIYIKISSRYSSMLLLGILFVFSLLASIAHKYWGYFQEYSSFLEIVFNTETLGPGRIIVFGIWLMFFYAVIEKYYFYIDRYLGWLLLKFGRNSLVTYIAQSVLLFTLFYIPIKYNFYITTVVNLVSIYLVWLLVSYIHETQKKKL